MRVKGIEFEEILVPFKMEIDNDHFGEFSNTMKSTPAWREWEKAGRAEPWIVEEDEA